MRNEIIMYLKEREQSCIFVLGAGVEFKQKFQLASRTSWYKKSTSPQIEPDHHGDNY